MPVETRRKARQPAAAPALAQLPPGRCWLLQSSTAVLASYCGFLRAVELLVVMRTCSALQQLGRSVSSDASSAVWGHATLRLALDKKLDEWAVPSDNQLRRRAGRSSYIPLSVWRTALPVLRYHLDRWNSERRSPSGLTWEVPDEFSWTAAAAIVRDDQPATRVVRVQGRPHTVLCKPSGDQLDETFTECFPSYRARFVLQAVPQLRHLRLIVDAFVVQPPPVSEQFPWVAGLRSLYLEQRDSDQTNTEQSIINIRGTLDALPRLTALYCSDISLGIQDMIDIAAAACPLDRIVLVTDYHRTAYRDRSGTASTSASTTVGPSCSATSGVVSRQPWRQPRREPARGRAVKATTRTWTRTTTTTRTRRRRRRTMAVTTKTRTTRADGDSMLPLHRSHRLS